MDPYSVLRHLNISAMVSSEFGEEAGENPSYRNKISFNLCENVREF